MTTSTAPKTCVRCDGEVSSGDPDDCYPISWDVTGDRVRPLTFAHRACPQTTAPARAAS